jgi:hypothetical protein
MFVVNESTGRRVNGTLGTVVRFEKTEEGLFSD